MSNLNDLKIFEDNENNTLIYVKKIRLELDKYVVVEVNKLDEGKFSLCILNVSESSLYIKEMKRKIKLSGNKYISLYRLYNYIKSHDFGKLNLFTINDIADLSSRLSMYDISILKTSNFISKDILKLKVHLDNIILNDYKKTKVITANSFNNFFEKEELNIEIVRLFQIVYGYSVLNKIKYGFTNEGYKMFFHFRNRILEVSITDTKELTKINQVEIVNLLNQLSISKDNIFKILSEKNGDIELYKY